MSADPLLEARVRSELEALRDWAAAQNAGNAFAAQVRYWAMAHLDRFDRDDPDIGKIGTKEHGDR